MQGKMQTCAEKEVQSVSAIKCNTKTKKDRAAGATTRHVILCDVASPWPRPCSRRLPHSSQSVPHDALGLSWTALRARTRPCQTRPPPVHTSAALAPNTKNPPSGGRHTHTASFGRRRSRRSARSDAAVAPVLAAARSVLRASYESSTRSRKRLIAKKHSSHRVIVRPYCTLH